MTDPVFLLRCVDCDANGSLSRLWIRASLQVGSGRKLQALHYVECMNCGAHLKSRHRDLMESVDEEEWSRLVGEDVERDAAPSPGMEQLS